MLIFKCLTQVCVFSGIFPHNEYPEEVSTDEDDEMFGSRKRIKKSKFRVNNDDDETPPVKKSKVDKKKSRCFIIAISCYNSGKLLCVPRSERFLLSFDLGHCTS